MDTNTTPINNAAKTTQDDYFVVNMETGKLELHFAKETYMKLDDSTKANIKSAFLWGRSSGCWISRCKEPNLWGARRVAEGLGLRDAGKIGERLSFAEQMAQKAEKAERRADRYDHRAEAAENHAKALQAPLDKMHGDVAFFTQPNISSSAGRAFTNRRNKMFQAYENGFKELRRSAYWAGRAETARETASQRELKDKYFVQRRIDERERDLRAYRRNVEGLEEKIRIVNAAKAKGETPRDSSGWEIKSSVENLEKQIEHWLDRIEVKLDELGFYQNCLDACGGVTFGPENIKPGYIVKMERWGVVEVVSTGPKNFKHKDSRSSIVLSDSYAAIMEIVKAVEPPKEQHPFNVGDTFIAERRRWDKMKYLGAERVTVTVIRSTEKSVTLQVGSEKPFVRKPKKCYDGRWLVELGDDFSIHQRLWFKAPAKV